MCKSLGSVICARVESLVVRIDSIKTSLVYGDLYGIAHFIIVRVEETNNQKCTHANRSGLL